MPIIYIRNKNSGMGHCAVELHYWYKCGKIGSPNYSFNAATVAGQITTLVVINQQYHAEKLSKHLIN